MTTNDEPAAVSGRRHTNTVLETRLRVPRSDVEIAADRLWSAGVGAIEIVDIDDQCELRTVLSESPDVSSRLIGPLRSTWRLDHVARDLTFARTWRQHSRPIVVSDRLAIVPEWKAFDPISDDQTVVTIEPGAAFGLGDHPTTRLMLDVIDALPLAGRSVLDVGTGTGVLAIVAARRGASPVVGLDISASAVEVAESNARSNDAHLEVSTTPLSAHTARYDVVLANILAPTLVALAPDLQRVTAPTGRLIISGVLVDGFDHVITALEPMQIDDQRQLAGWAVASLVWPTRR